MKNRLSDNNEQAEPQQLLPYERKVLLECPVAGVGFHDIDDIWDELYIGAQIALSLPPERTGYPVLENKQKEKNIGLPGSSYFCCLKEEVNHP